VSDQADGVDGPTTLLGPGIVATGFRDPTIIDGGGIAWRADRIVEVGAWGDIVSRHPGTRTIDAEGGLILPGLVNLHHHFYSSLARGLDPRWGMHDFASILRGLWWRLDRALDPRTVRLSAELALADSIRWGATTVFDHHASPGALEGSLELIAEAVGRAGLSAALCYEISDRNGHDEAMRGLDENLSFCLGRRVDRRVRGMIGLHASFTLLDETLDAVAAQRGDAGVHVHLAEDPADIRISEERFGARPMARFERFGLLDGGALAVHGIHLAAAERRRLAELGVTLVHNPESNANNGVGRLDLDAAAAAGCRIGLGTDGMSSAMLGALRAAFLGSRGGSGDPTRGFSIVPDLLAVNAEIAGRLFDEPLLGRLEPGAPADLCVLDSAPPTPVTSDSLFAHLVYGSSQSPVRHTVARGRVLLEDHRFTSLDPVAIAAEAREAVPALWERFRGLEPSGPAWMSSDYDR
jgi:putative selenium metabolism protein SsnA